MLVSNSFKDNIIFLASTDPKNNSVSIDPKNHSFKHTPKKTKTQKRVSSAIHALSFSCVSRNDQLDRVTEYIFNQIQHLDYNMIKLSEKLLLKKAFKNLEEIIEINEGNNQKEIQELYNTIDKIQVFETFQILIPN